MNAIKRTTRFFLLITAFEIALILTLAIAFSGKAEAHTLRPSVCTAQWHDAPPGHKWQVKQLCIAYVRKHNCIAHQRPVPRSVEVKGRRVDSGQRHVLGWLVNEAQRRRLPKKVLVSSIAATTQEASARELRHGHGSSLGPFQLISSHGTYAQRITVEFSGNWYFNGAVKVVRGNPGIAPAALAQAVERSAYPSAYAQWVPEARRTAASILGPCIYYVR